MHRSLSLAAGALLLLSACKVERTPDTYLSDRRPARVEEEQARAELRTRVGAFREALNRGDADAAVAALSPTATAVVYGAEDAPGAADTGPAALAAAVRQMAVGREGATRTPDLQVEVGLPAGLGWFTTHLDVLPGDAAELPERMRLSGVFRRQKGAWGLVQLHLSRATPPPAPPAATSPAADSAKRADG